MANLIRRVAEARATIPHLFLMGAVKQTPSSVLWRTAGRCEKPHRVTLTYRPHTSGWRRTETVSSGLWLDIDVRCRKCANCLKARSALWRGRASTEIGASPRTWFGTLTLNPQAHFRALTAARAAAHRKGDDFDRMPSDKQFALRCREVGKELTLYLKRVRKAAGPFRYCLVFERHKNGLPHVHMLVHEQAAPIRHRTLVDKWRLGFTNFKLVSEGAKAAAYVSKYLAKSAIARVRASEGYGRAFLHSAKAGLGLDHSDNRNVNEYDPSTQTLCAGGLINGSVPRIISEGSEKRRVGSGVEAFKEPRADFAFRHGWEVVPRERSSDASIPDTRRETPRASSNIGALRAMVASTSGQGCDSS